MVLAVADSFDDGGAAGAAVQVRLLGGVSAVTDEGAIVDVGPAKCQILLAALALSAGSAVPVARLVDLVWGLDAPRTAEKTLQSYVARLRKSLGPEAIARVGSAYSLTLDRDAVDVARFQRRLESGDVAGALAEWQGTPLAGLAAPGLEPTVSGLVEQWLAAVEADLEAVVEADPASAIGPLTELTTSHPFREGLWALLMTALYVMGRQADALAAYRRARVHLVEELGVEPGPRLSELEASILGHADELRDRARADGPTSPVPTGTVTFAFSELEESTKLWTTNRPNALGAITRYEELVRSAAERHHGHVFATSGDSFGLAFDRAGEAADWALDLQASIGAEPWPGGSPIRIRIGLNTGDAEERGHSYFGPAVNIAAHIASAAHGGQTLVSRATAALLDGHELRDLGLALIDGMASEQQLNQLGPGEHPPLRADGRRLGNLPRSSGRLYGRADLLDEAAAALEASSIVTLVGPGGIGKTRLALDIARLAGQALTGGLWLVELADVTTSDDVARAVADVLDIPEVLGRSRTESVVSVLAARGALLVLDNCEHVIEGAAELSAAIVEESPDLRVLATSREGLGIPGEQLVIVGPLDAGGPGIALFEERAKAVDRSFDAEQHRTAVEEICRRVDGVPLAIELAAARIRTLSPDDMVERLDDSFRLLGGGRRRSVERHRTIRATIRWSYDLLSPRQQMLFRRLSIFAGSFDLDAAEQVAVDDNLDAVDVSVLVDDLVERSIVVAESGAYGRRFRLLEIMRQFGAEQLAEAGTTDLIAARHAQYIVTQVGQISEQLAGRREVEGAGRLTELWPNLRAAVEWAADTGDIELTKALVGPLATQAFLRRGTAELADWSEHILAMAEPDDEETIAYGLLWTAFHHLTTYDRPSYARIEERYGGADHILVRVAHNAIADDDQLTLDLAPEAAALLRGNGDELAASLLEVFIGGALLSQGRLDDAEAHLQRLLDRFRKAGPATYLNWTLFMLAATADFRSDHVLAESLYDESLAVPVPPRTNSPNEVLRARTAFRSGDRVRAFTVLRSYVEELLDVRNLSGAGLISLEFVNMMVASEHLDEAARILGYLDVTGMLQAEGPGFHQLVTEAAAQVDADPEAAATRRRLATEAVDDEWALTTIRDMLEVLLDRGSTASPPTDHQGRPT